MFRRHMDKLREKILAGERINKQEAVSLFNWDLVTLGWLASSIRWRLHPEPVVTYIVDRNINYSNICISGCKFCAFWRPKGHKEAYVLSKEELTRKIEETIALGGIQILLQGGLHPDWTIYDYEELLVWIKTHYPQIWIHGLSAPEVAQIAHNSGLSIKETLQRLKKAGLDSIPGGGAEILVDRVRKQLSPRKCDSATWLKIMETAHELGIKTTATMMFGHIETYEERIEHMLKIRDLQDKTGGFTAFICWTFQPQNTALSHLQAVGAVEYLKTLAIARIVLDNVPNLQASWVTQGAKIGQLSLFFGANDMGSLMIEENVVAATGVHFRMQEEEMQYIIEQAGFRPQRRNMWYEWVNDG
ncbi:MAG: dehypoxanthine futalosine cyclase [Candidatus Desulfofervidaceae bacterium]|nr:dehypoxanthine futalosine cyclase [Candidatus Desulfofervidaceae bacterium]